MQLEFFNITKLNLEKKFLYKCYCGHYEADHKAEHSMASWGDHWCRQCSDENRYGTIGTFNSMFHTFTLDNLSYIEDLANDRGLI